jgi:hypothetical protein
MPRPSRDDEALGRQSLELPTSVRNTTNSSTTTRHLPDEYLLYPVPQSFALSLEKGTIKYHSFSWRDRSQLKGIQGSKLTRRKHQAEASLDGDTFTHHHTLFSNLIRAPEAYHWRRASQLRSPSARLPRGQYPSPITLRTSQTRSRSRSPGL